MPTKNNLKIKAFNIEEVVPDNAKYLYTRWLGGAHMPQFYFLIDEPTETEDASFFKEHNDRWVKKAKEQKENHVCNEKCSTPKQGWEERFNYEFSLIANENKSIKDFIHRELHSQLTEVVEIIEGMKREDDSLEPGGIYGQADAYNQALTDLKEKLLKK